jgi:hypothetical protein
MDRQLLKHGLSFDILWKEQEVRCDLVELNVFGARISPGLFHWVMALDVLYWNEHEGEIAGCDGFWDFASFSLCSACCQYSQ